MRLPIHNHIILIGDAGGFPNRLTAEGLYYAFLTASHAAAAYTPTWAEYILIQAPALSGKVTVLGTRKVGDKSYMILRLSDLRFDAIDHSCVYSINGTVEYEIWDIQQE